MKKGLGLILRLLPGLFSLLCSGILFYGAVCVVQEMERQVPASVEVYSQNGIGISMKEAAELAADGIFSASGMGQEVSVQGGISGSVRNAWMEVTTSAYGEVAGMNFVGGGYFTEAIAAEKQKYIVIPESLAIELFGFDAGISQSVFIAGVEYTVCGVYKEGGYLTKLGLGSIPVIYTNSFQESESGTTVNQIMFMADDNKTGGQLRQEAAAQIGRTIEGELLELDNLLELASDLILIGGIICLLWFVFRLFVFSNRQFLAAYDEKRDAVRRRNHFLAAIISLAAALAGLNLLLGSIKLPPSFLPEDNLFDFSYYAGMILDSMQWINTRRMIKDFLRVSAVFLFTEVLLLIPAVILFWTGCKKLISRRKWEGGV